MKKLKVLLSAIALIASMTLVGCNQPTGTGANAGTDTDASTGTGSTTQEWDGIVDLTGKTTKNATAFTKAYDGFVIDFGRTVDLTQYSKLEVTAKFFDADNTEIAATWGLGQFLVLDDPQGDWGAHTIKTQYNLGMQNWDSISTDTESLGSTNAKAIAIQNSTADVKYIEVTEIKFVK